MLQHCNSLLFGQVCCNTFCKSSCALINAYKGLAHIFFFFKGLKAPARYSKSKMYVWMWRKTKLSDTKEKEIIFGYMKWNTAETFMMIIIPNIAVA